MPRNVPNALDRRRGARLSRGPKPEAKAETPDSYTSSQVAKLAGVTLRQLQWWDERRIIIARHVGHARQWSSLDVVQACVVAKLRDKGLSLQGIREGCRELQIQLKAFSERQPDRMLIAVNAEDFWHAKKGRIVKRGAIAAISPDPALFAEILAGYPRPVVVVEISRELLERAA